MNGDFWIAFGALLALWIGVGVVMVIVWTAIVWAFDLRLDDEVGGE